MSDQIKIIFAFFITGVFIGIMFDIFRISRKSFKTPNIITYIEDVIFWILAGSITLFTIFTYTTGEIRLYMIIFLIFGSFIYFISISKYFIIVSIKIISIFKSFINAIITPFQKILKLIKSSIKKTILFFNTKIVNSKKLFNNNNKKKKQNKKIKFFKKSSGK